MGLTQSNHAKGIATAPYPGFAGQAVTHRFTVAIPADAALNDIFEVAPVPPGCRPVDIVLDVDDLDTGTAAITLDVGMMSGDFGDNDDSRTCGAEFFDGIDTAQAGGVARPTLASAYRVPVAAKARSIGVKIATAADAGQAGTIGLTVTYATE